MQVVLELLGLLLVLAAIFGCTLLVVAVLHDDSDDQVT